MCSSLILCLQECFGSIKDATTGRSLIPLMVHRSAHLSPVFEWVRFFLSRKEMLNLFPVSYNYFVPGWYIFCQICTNETFQSGESECLSLNLCSDMVHRPGLLRLLITRQRFPIVLLLCSRSMKDHNFEGIFCVVLKRK